jgi:hypothetical protein
MKISESIESIKVFLIDWAIVEIMIEQSPYTSFNYDILPIKLLNPYYHKIKKLESEERGNE